MTTLAVAPAAFEAGVYDIPEDVYHADPVPGGSLSVSGAKKLLPPSCPAKFHYERTNPKPPSQAMELGTAAHHMVLGVGQRITLVEAKDWRTKAAQEQAEEIRTSGGVPLLAADHERVKAMAAALRAHPVASALLSPERGDPERSLFWLDEEFGIMRRARLDHMPHPSGGRMIAADYKTTHSADPAAISKSVYNYRYHMQDPWYRDGMKAMFPGADVAFLFIFQETDPPYLVTVAEIDSIAYQAGRDANRRAMEIYRDCTEAGIWPGYSATSDIELISLPAWAERRYFQGENQ